MTNKSPEVLQSPPSHEKASPILKYFTYAHLPQRLQATSKLFWELADNLDGNISPCPEKSAGLRKLLEAKDCFVRALVE